MQWPWSRPGTPSDELQKLGDRVRVLGESLRAIADRLDAVEEKLASDRLAMLDTAEKVARRLGDRERKRNGHDDDAETRVPTITELRRRYQGTGEL